MRYISPFKLFPTIDFSSEVASSISYTKLKRKLLAEFELNDNQPLSIGGETVGKSEALRVLESLKDEAIFKEHLAIAKDRELRLFIEGKSSDYIENPYNKRKQISDLIAEEFVEEYDRVVSVAFQKGNKKRLMQVLAFPVQEVALAEKSPFEGVFRKLKNEVANLEELDTKTGKEQESAIKLIQDDFRKERLVMINALPIDFFYLRNELGYVLINIGCSIHNERGNGYLAGKLFRFVEHLDCDESYRELAAENFTIVKGESSHKYDNNWKWSWWQIIGVILLSVKLLHYCSSSSSSTYTPATDVSEGILNVIENRTSNKNYYKDEIGYRIGLLNYDSIPQVEKLSGVKLFSGMRLFERGGIPNAEHRKHKVYNLFSQPTVVGVFSASFELKGNQHRDEKVESSCWYYVEAFDTLTLPRSGFSEMVFLTGKKWGKTNLLAYIGGGNPLEYKDSLGFFTKDIKVVDDVGRRTAIIGLNDTTFYYEVGTNSVLTPI